MYLLHDAVQEANVAEVKRLLASTEVDVNSQNIQGETALHCAIADRSTAWFRPKIYEAILRLLLIDQRTNLLSKNSGQETLFDVVVRRYCYDFYSYSDEDPYGQKIQKHMSISIQVLYQAMKERLILNEENLSGRYYPKGSVN